MQYTVSNERMQITADTLGGELISVICDGKERMWQTETGVWKGHAPLLFPVCGHCDMIVDGKEYPISAHGFAKKAEFALKEQGKDYLIFSLQANEKTKEMYPFDFVLEMKYSIADNVLTVSHTVKNMGEGDCYFSLGGHESYALDKPLSKYELVFEKEEELIHLYHNPKGYLSGGKRKFYKGRKFILPQSFLINSKTLIFSGLKSRKVQLKERGGKPLANITFDGFDKLLLWHCPGGAYICIEPWLNLPDTLGEKKEFSKKEGVVKLQAGEEKTYQRTMEYL